MLRIYCLFPSLPFLYMQQNYTVLVNPFIILETIRFFICTFFSIDKLRQGWSACRCQLCPWESALFPDAAVVFPVFVRHSHSGSDKCDVADSTVQRTEHLICTGSYDVVFDHGGNQKCLQLFRTATLKGSVNHREGGRSEIVLNVGIVKLKPWQFFDLPTADQPQL